MTRAEYMNRLQVALAELSDQEREDAVRYYNDYLDEGGIENEEANLDALGSPEELAKEIKNGMGIEKSGESTQDETTGEHAEESSDRTWTGSTQSSTQTGSAQNSAQTGAQNGAQNGQKQMSTSNIILLVILGIFALPILVPVIVSIFSVLISILATMVGVAISLFAACAALLFASVLVFGIGIWGLFQMPAVGLILIGVSLLLFAIGLALTVLCVLLCRLAIPPFAKWICELSKSGYNWVRSKFSGKKVQS